MAKRSRRAREYGKSRRQRRARRRQWLIGGIAAVLVVLGAGAAYAYLTRDQPGEKITDMGNQHIGAEPSSYVWNSRPPTSGPHIGQLAGWGEQQETVPEVYQVHNLEDGGVIMHYNCPEGCPDEVAALRDIMADVGPDRLILHPYTNMESRFAVTAWTRLLTLDAVDRDQIVAFIDAYRGLDHHR